MKFLLTSCGISNNSINNALVQLLGKPIAEANTLLIATGMHPYPDMAGIAWQIILGKSRVPLVQLGWKSLGILELTALPTLNKENWVAAVQQTDALLVWGGDVLYLSHWLWQSGLAEVLHSIKPGLVYVGVSAGSMVTAHIIGETPSSLNRTTISPLTAEQIVLSSPEGEKVTNFITAKGLALVDFAIIPHLDGEEHWDASTLNAEKWAARIPSPVYAIDDHTAIQVADGKVEVISEGNWKLFNKA